MTHPRCRLTQPRRSAEFQNTCTIRRCCERQQHQLWSFQDGIHCAPCACMRLSRFRPCRGQRSNHQRQSLCHRLYYRKHHVGHSWTVVCYQFPYDRPSNKCHHRHDHGVLCGPQTTGPTLHVPVDRPAGFWYLTGAQL